jgi:DedD protein
MPKSKEFRELQVSSGQLAAVILSLLALCVFVFFLGTRVGAKKNLLAAAGGSPGAKTETVLAPQPVSPDPAPSTLAAGGAAADTKAPAERPNPKKPAAGTKTEPPADASLKPLNTTTTPALKTKAEPEAKPASPGVKKEPPVPAAAGKPAAKSAGSFYVQVAAVDARPAAEMFARKIEALGFSVLVLDPQVNDKRTVYRVRIGPFNDKTEAESARTKLAAALKKKRTDYFIVK